MTKAEALATLGRPGEYEVYTNSEALEKCIERIGESLCLFKPQFILEYTDLPRYSVDVLKLINVFCSANSKSANDAIRLLVGDRFNKLVADVLSLHGRGPFLATYDGDEIAHAGYFFYRVN